MEALSPRNIRERKRIYLLLQACRHVAPKRGRILPNFMAIDDGEEWTNPLVTLVDTLITARMHMKEAFNAEIEGFADTELRGGNHV